MRPWAVKKYRGLYCTNERVVLNGVWNENDYFGFAAGNFKLCLIIVESLCFVVGALNVGSIEIEFDRDIKTNDKALKILPKLGERNYPQPVPRKRGEKLGAFNFGSTVVMIFESSEEFTFNVQPGDKVKVGERIGVNSPGTKASATVACPPWSKSN